MNDARNEFAPLHTVLVKHARDAFVSQSTIDRSWRSLNYTAPPDFARAVEEYDAFLEVIASTGASIVQLPPSDAVTLESIYTRDATILSPDGLVLASMGKTARRAEPAAQAAALGGCTRPFIGEIRPPGLLEGGDVVWLDDSTILVGKGKRTNAEGIRQFQALIGSHAEALEMPLPDVAEAHDCVHLMSFLSPVDTDLAVIYSNLMPPALRVFLESRGVQLVDVPDHEYETMGTNVLALAPRVCVMLRGNSATRRALERAGAHVIEYHGSEISLKGGGGPTCLTRPLARCGVT
jgi:N-dimethylarginine dimethylaminohydrolase